MHSNNLILKALIYFSGAHILAVELAHRQLVLQLGMNPNLKNLDDDFLYHLGYSKSDGLDVLFGDVKVKQLHSLWLTMYSHLLQSRS